MKKPAHRSPSTSAAHTPSDILSKRDRDRIEGFRSQHATEMLVILFTDIEGFTALKSKRGDEVARRLLEEHKELLRQALSDFASAEWVKDEGDSFLFCFLKPGDAVQFALRALFLHRQHRGDVSPGLPHFRIGIHLGTVFVERSGGSAAGEKFKDILGLQADITNRVMSLADGGHILCSRIVFDDARQSLKGTEILGIGLLSWRSHGFYVLKGREESMEVCEVGEKRFAAFKKPVGNDKAQPLKTHHWRRLVLGVLLILLVAVMTRLAFHQELEVARNRAAQSETQATAKQTEAEQARKQAEDETYRSRVLKVAESIKTDGGTRAREDLWQLPEARRQWEWGFLLNQAYRQCVFSIRLHPEHTATFQYGDKGTAHFSPDGRHFLTTGYGGGVSVWDTKSAKKMFTLKNGTKGIEDPQYSPDGTCIVTRCIDKTTKTWDAESGSEILASQRRPETGDDARMSPDGQSAAPEPTSSTPGVWNGELGKELLDLRQAGRTPRAVLSKGGRYVLTAQLGISPGSVSVWNPKSGGELASFTAPGIVGDVEFSPDERFVLTGSYDALTLWEIEPVDDLALLTDPDSGTTKFSPDGRRILGCQSGAAKIWDIVSGTELTSVASVHKICDGYFGSERVRILGTALDGCTKVWDAESGKELASFADPKMNDAQFSPDGRRVRTTGGNGFVPKIWDADTGNEIIRFPTSNNGVTWVDFSPDGRLVTVSRLPYYGKPAEVWDMDSGKELAVFPQPAMLFLLPRFSPDGQKVLMANYSAYDNGGMVPPHVNYKAKIWDARSGRELLSLEEIHRQDVSVISDAQFSPDSKRVAMALIDCTVGIWDAVSGKLLLTLAVHADGVSSLCFSPDGRRIVTCSNDKTVEVWDAESGDEILTLPGHAVRGGHIQFSPDGRYIELASHDGAVVWAAAPWRKEDLPGDDSMTWRERFTLWRTQESDRRHQHATGVR